MKNCLLFFIDNIEEAISLQSENLLKTIESYNNGDMKLKTSNNGICIGNEINITISGKQIIVNEEDSDEIIEDSIRREIIPLLDEYEIIHFAVDCNLDDEEKHNTSYKFINSLLNITNNCMNNIIISIVSAHYQTSIHQKQVINKLETQTRETIKFLSRPMNNRLDHLFWDNNLSSSGRYDLGNILYNVNEESREYEIIEELLYADNASSNYFGILLVRFLRNEKIDQAI